jgi:hypothetical protein
MKRHWLYYFSPFILVAIASLIPIGKGLAEMNKHESFGVIDVFMNGAALLLLLGVDRLIKNLTNGKILYIWIIEASIVLLLVGLFYRSSFRL